MNGDYLFKAEKICKSFGLTKALTDVDLQIEKGEIQGLIGENGSGKSTLASICAGMQRPDSGSMYFNESRYNPCDTVDAANQGVGMIVQEQNTVGMVTVAANIFMGLEDIFVKSKVLSVRKMYQEAQRILASIGAEHIDPKKMIDTLTFEDRKLVEIARALYMSPRLLIVDETTTALTVTGRDRLYSIMNRLRDAGNSILFISHDVEEIIELCDSLTILQDGTRVAKLIKAEFDSDKIKQLMIGKELSGHYYRKDNSTRFDDTVVLEARSVSKGILKDISFSLHKSEILGFCGLSHCGMHQLGKILFGLIPPDIGSVILYDKMKVSDTTSAVRKGIAYLSKNRDRDSMMIDSSIKDNICLPSLDNLKKFGVIRRKSELLFSDKWMKKLNIKASSVNQYCNTLSGGNKQKVVLAKWLGKDSDILILDCPTRGIDIGTKASIYEIIENLKNKGKSIILISEELAELIGMSDRIIALKDGVISGEFKRTEGLTKAKLIQKMI